MKGRLEGIEVKEDALLRISYGVLFLVLPAIAGFIVWLTNLNFSVQANASEISRIEDTMDRIGQSLSKIEQKLANIEGLLKQKNPENN